MSGINWAARSVINSLTNESLCHGEEKELSYEEVDEINTRFRNALVDITRIDSMFAEARKRFIAR